MNIQQVPYEPGDTVRDKRTSKDYVIQSIVGLGGGIATIYAINVMSNKLDSWRATSEADFKDHLIMRKGYGASPESVVNMFQEKINDALKHHHDILKELDKPGNEALRDLLILSAGHDEGDFLTNSYLKLAESLITLQDNIPDRHIVLEILKENFPDAPEESLTYISQNIESYAKARVKTNKFMTQGTILRDLMHNTPFGFGGDAVIMANRKSLSQHELLRKAIIGDPSTAKILERYLPEIQGLRGAKRIEALAEIAFKNQGGNFSAVTQDFVAKNSDNALRAITGNLKNSKKAQRAEMLLDVIGTHLLRSNRKLEAELNGRTVQSFNPVLHYDGARLANMRRKAIRISTIQASENTESARSVFSKATAYRTHRSKSKAAFMSLDISQMLKMAKDNPNKKFAVSKSAFFNSVIGNARVKINKAEGSLNQSRVISALKDSLGESADPYFILSAKELQLMESMKSSGTPIELDDVMRLSSERIDLLDSSDRLQLGRDTFTTGDTLGVSHFDRAAFMPLEETYNKKNSSYSKVWFVDDPDTFKRTAVGNLDQAQALLDERKLDLNSLSYAELGHTNKYRKAVLEAGDKGIEVADQYFGGKRLLPAQSLAEGVKLSTASQLGAFLRKTSTKELNKALRIDRGNPHAILSAAFEEGYQQGKLAVANIKTPSGSKTKIMGSDIDRSLDLQIQRAKDYYEKGIILDIESFERKDGKAAIRQIAVGSFDDPSSFVKKDSDFLYKKSYSASRSAESLINLADHLTDRIQGGARSVGTAGPHDFKTIISQTTELLEDVRNWSPSAKRDYLLSRLEKSLATFERIERDYLFDIQLIYQVAGFDLGSTSQSYITRTILGKEVAQKHTAKQDVKDALGILKKLQGRFQEAEVNLIDTKNIPKENMFLVDNSTMGPQGSKIRKFLGFSSVFDKNGKNVIHAAYQEYQSELQGDGSYQLLPTNNFYSESAENVSALGARMQKTSTIFQQTEWNKILDAGESLATRHQRLLRDSSERAIRSLNPLNSALFDDLGIFDSKIASWGGVQLGVTEQVADLYPKALERIDYMSQKLLKKSARDLSTTEQLNLYNQYLEQIIDNTMMTKDLQNSNMAPYIREKLRRTILESPLGKPELSPEFGALKSFMETPTGASLLESSRKSIRNVVADSMDPNTFWLNEADHVEMDVKNIFYRDQAARKTIEKYNTAIQGGLATDEFFKESVPRFSMKAHLDLSDKYLAASHKFTGEDSIAKFNSVDTLASELVLNSASLSNEHRAIDVIKNSVDFDIFKEQLENYKKYSEQNLPEYKQQIEKLSFIGEEAEFGELRKAQRALANSDFMKDALLAELDKKLAKHADQNSSEDILRFGQSLRSQVEELAPRDLQENMTQVFFRAQEEDSENFTKFLSEKYFDIPSIGSLTAEEVSEADDKSMGVLKRLYDATNKSTSDFTAAEALREVDLVSSEAYKVMREVQSTQNTLEYHTTSARSLNQILDLHNQGLSWAQIQNQMRTGTSEIKATQQVANRGAATAMSENAVQEATFKAAHRIAAEELTGTATTSLMKSFSRVSTPLMALGGVLGLMAANNPNLGDSFSQGLMSDNLSSNTPEGMVAKFSEIPGTPDQQAVWRGEVSPFRLDITFSGFVKDKRDHDRLQREVYNILSSNVEVRSRTSDVQDQRNQGHALAARESLRGLL